MTKASLIITGIIVFLSALSSCDNEVDLAADWKDIPIVFGLIDQDISENYIRLEKAFLDPNTNALEIAKIADSLYYTNATVFIRNLSRGGRFFLEKIDATEENILRDTGIFAHQPNYLYKLNGPTNFEGGDLIELNIIRSENTDTVKSACVLISDMKLSSPSSDFGIDFKPNSGTSFRWRDVDEAGVYDIWIDMYYEETNLTTSETVLKSIFWEVENGIIDNKYSVPGDLFFKKIRDELDPDHTGQVDPNTVRRFRTLDIFIVAGGHELFDLRELLKVSSSGITGAVEVEPYSNISEGFGIFSSIRILESEDHFLSTNTVDSLRDGQFTKHLQFQ